MSHSNQKEINYLKVNWYITENKKEFPNALFYPNEIKKYGSKIKAIFDQNNTRPTPERIESLLKLGLSKINRDDLDRAFILSCQNSFTPDYLKSSYLKPSYLQPDYCKIDDQSALNMLINNMPNMIWVKNVLKRAAIYHKIKVSEDITVASWQVMNYLFQESSYWELDDFSLEAMMDLKNRYDWTFTSYVWSLYEQLRQEAQVVNYAWRQLFKIALKKELFVILNEKTPTDYLTAKFPDGVILYNKDITINTHFPIILYTGLKISSSEHRTSIKNTEEGYNIERAVDIALKLNRIPVFIDFSRRRFPRSFMRLAFFAKNIGWGIEPIGKVLDKDAEKIPSSKSCKGFSSIDGDPVIMLFDPWPISDGEIVKNLHYKVKQKFCRPPFTKPWQDDRIGARQEMEQDNMGIYSVTSQPWIFPMFKGWIKTDDLFKSRLARFIKSDFT